MKNFSALLIVQRNQAIHEARVAARKARDMRELADALEVSLRTLQRLVAGDAELRCAVTEGLIK